jgi:hypothetical protein
MKNELYLTKSPSLRLGQSCSKLSILVSTLVLLFGVVISGCQKDNSAGTSPDPSFSSNLASKKGNDNGNTLAPVNLGTAANFTILSESGISTTGVTSITGDIGVSPIAATAITGFGLIMDASGLFATAPNVTGDVYAASYGGSTATKMTTAISDMQTAYTTANGLTKAAIVEKYAGDISGRTLSPGLYKWSTGVLVTSVGTTLKGGPNDVWVFQIAQNLTINNGAIIHLTGGAQAKNIFWVVAGEATLGTTVNFSGIILSKTLISLNTGATVTGRLLAQTAVTLIANTVKP